MAQELPPNWRSAKDSDGKEYYFNELTGETSWSFPEGDLKPPAVAAVQSPPVVMQMPMSAADSSEFAPAEEPPMVQPPNYGNGGKRAGFPGRGGGSGGLSATLGEGVLPRVAILMFCSVVVLFQSCISSGRVPEDAVAYGAAENYGISVGSIALGFCIGFLTLAKKKPDVFANWTLPKVRGDLSVSHLFALFMVAWWTPATAILTFFSPFTMTSNAYFCTWAALITSFLMLARAFARVQIAFKSMSAIQEDANVKALAGLTLASAVVLFGSIEYLGTPLGGEATFSLLSGCVSVVGSSGMYYMVDRKKVGPPVKKAFAAFVVLLWTLCAAVLTFDGPFNATGNGYFGTWIALFCSVSFAYQEYVGGELPLGVVKTSFAFAPFDADEPISPSVQSSTNGDVA